MKGQKTGGRLKGTPNKLQGDVKAMILGALSDVGGRDWLAMQAEENPVAFMSLLGRVLPLQVQGQVDSNVSYVIRAPTPVESADEWLALHAPSDRREPVTIDAQPERETESKD